MSGRYAIDGDTLTGIAGAIRTKLGVQTQYTPAQMSAAIGTIPTGGSATLQEKTATQNGIILPDSGYDGLSKVTVNVSQGSGDILTGIVSPSSSLGSDGDVYKQTFALPANVDFVEYLRSSGTQYINTGVYASNDIDVEFVFEHLSGDISTFGCRTGSYSSSSKAIYLNDYGSMSFGKTTSSYDFANASRRSYSTGTVVRAKTDTIKDGNQYTFLTYLDEKICMQRYKQEAFVSDNPMLLFGGYIDRGIVKGASKFFRVTIFDKKVPVHDYLPCLDTNGVPCMWDNIAKEYVYNDGTGDFTYGSTATPTPLDDLYYVKVNGAWEVIQP